MKIKIQLLLLILFFAYCNSISQNRIQINIPTAEMETDYVWRTIQDIPFFRKNNYQISLPKGRLIETLKNKSELGSLSDKDYEDLKIYMRDSVYQKSDYQRGYEKIKNELALINKAVLQLEKSKRNWHFRAFDTYNVNLTLYGPGGSYNPEDGSILIYTSPNGSFKQYENPANTIIHEIVHIGIEASIIHKYNVPHPLKERIVDNFVLLNFEENLPDYRLQDMGDHRIDKYLKKKEDLEDLDRFVAEIMGN